MLEMAMHLFTGVVQTSVSDTEHDPMVMSLRREGQASLPMSQLPTLSRFHQSSQ